MSTWKKEVDQIGQKEFPQLNREISVDVAIIGGGITGLLNAYRLMKAGKKVAVIEKNKIGSLATFLTTAFITEVIDTDLTKVVSLFGEDGARAVWKANEKAITDFEELIAEENIDCNFMRCSDITFSRSEKDFDTLKEEYEMYVKLGLPAILHQKSDDLSFKQHGYMEVPNQAKFNVAEFLLKLTKICVEGGVQIFEQTEVVGVDGDGPITVSAAKGKVIAQNIIIATYQPFTNEKTHLKKGMYVSYVFEVELPKDTLKEGLYEDTDNPYHYFRIDSGETHDRMIIGGEDHKDIFGTTLEEKSFQGLEKYLKELLPQVSYTIKEKWSGPILEPSDGLPLIGEIKKGYYVATAFSGNGMTYSMISSSLIKDSMEGRSESELQKVLDPTRALLHPKRLASKAKDYVEEFVGGALKNMLEL